MEEYIEYFQDAYNNYAKNKKDYLQSSKNQTFNIVSDEEITSIQEKLQASGELFQDSVFPPSMKSLYGNYRHNLGVNTRNNSIQWLRPLYIVGEPKFISNGVTKFDIKQGQLGDCWFLASAALLAEHEDLFNQVVLPEQTFDSPNYNGMFIFKFWQCGKWVNVIVDDYLPTIYGGRQLLFVSSTDPTEFWVALLEKAYAKLYGCYAAIVGGFIPEALQDLTGGICQTITLHDARGKLKSSDFYKDIFLNMLESHQQGGLLGCVIHGSGESETSLGLIRGHAYSINNVSIMKYKDQNVAMIQIRNPWGNHVEWKGRFHDNSPEWDDITTGDNISIDHNPADGEYWMTFYDFIVNFNEVTVCDLYNSPIKQNTWQLCQFFDEWVLHTTAGGAFNVNHTFYRNPQYAITINNNNLNKQNNNSNFSLNNLSTSSESLYKAVFTNEDNDTNDDTVSEYDDNKMSIVISLMQLNNRMENVPVGCIGIAVFKVTDEDIQKDKPLSASFFRKYAQPDYFSDPYAYSRETNLRLNVTPGNYIIVPTMFYNNTEGEYYLRILSIDPNFKAIPHDNFSSRKKTILEDEDNFINNDDTVDDESKKMDSSLILKFINGNNNIELTEYINTFIEKMLNKYNNNDLLNDGDCNDKRKKKINIMCCGNRNNGRTKKSSKKKSSNANDTNSHASIIDYFKFSQSQIESIFNNCKSMEQCNNRLNLIKKTILKLLNLKDIEKFILQSDMRDIFSKLGYITNNQFLNTIGKIYKKKLDSDCKSAIDYMIYCTILELSENPNW
ncbi:MAG: calpain-like protein [Cotesia congregata filamentous virus 2]